MIDELKTNVETEIEILRELSNYSARLELATPQEKKLLEKSTKSLRERIKLINQSVPKLLKDISFAKRLPGKVRKTDFHQIGFERSKSRVNVTLQTKDKEKFLKELSISENSIRRLKKGDMKKDEDEGEEFKASRGYLKLSNKFFLDRSLRMVKKGWFETLSTQIGKANIDVLFETYIAMMLFTSFISIFVGLFIMILLMFVSFSFAFPFISMFSGNYLIRFAQVFWIPLVLPLLVFGFLYIYPSTERKSLSKKIDQELPFAVIHMSAISGSGIEPSEIFKIIGLSKEYPNLRREIRKVLNQINLYGYDLVTALTNVSKSTSCARLAELFSGLGTTINSGGDLKEFFEKRSETLLVSYRLEREKYTRVAETFMDIYISVVIAAPMILMLLFIMIAVSGIQTGFSTNGITFIIISIITVINVLFIGFLNLKQPTY